MENKISINDLYKVIKGNNLKLISNVNGVVTCQKGKEIIKLTLTDYLNQDIKLVRPNYDNSILNIISSIKKYYGFKPDFKTHAVIDELLDKKQYNHISIFLLDGMGSYIMNDNLDSNSFLSKNKLCDLSSLFPPTTACMIPAVMSGLPPIKTGWVGWENYFEEINRHVVMFKNTDYYTDEKLDFNTNEVLPYDLFYKDFNTHVFELGPSFHPSNCQSIQELCDKYLVETKKNKTTFSYLYWDEPDYSLHEFGSNSKEVKDKLKQIDTTIEDMYQKMEKDSLMVITADHGHIAVKNIYLANFKDLTKLLKRYPSNEGRCAFFKVKLFRKKKFKKLFNLYFSSYFTLINRKDFIKEEYLGKSDLYNKRLDSFIGDFVGIAKGNYSFVFNPKITNDSESDLVFVSHHAGMTANELITPLIILAK